MVDEDSGLLPFYSDQWLCVPLDSDDSPPFLNADIVTEREVDFSMRVFTTSRMVDWDRGEMPLDNEWDIEVNMCVFYICIFYVYFMCMYLICVFFYSFQVSKYYVY